MAARASRPRLAVALSAVCLATVALAGCGGSGSTRGGPSTIMVAAAKPPPTDAAAAALPPATADAPVSGSDAVAPAPSPALAHMQRVLTKYLQPAAAQSGMLVYDLTAHQTLFAMHAAVGRPPASVEKLYTSIAALTLLGPASTFPTTVLGAGHLGAGGVWYGNLYLRGDGDPTFGDGTFNKVDEDGYGPTAEELVAQLVHAGIRRVTGLVIGDESRFDRLRGGPLTDYAPDPGDYFGQLSALVYDHGATAGKLSPGAFAAHELVLVMRSSHIQARASSATGVTSPDATPLASVSSPPLSVLIRLMDVPSDDLIADMLAKQLGATFAGHGTLSAGAQQIGAVIAGTYGLRPTILDGSGLDKLDRSSPSQIVTLLRDVWPTPAGRLLAASLPVVGRTGTVQTIGLDTAAVGRCVAKTGTLNYVTNLAGYCHAVGGHLLVFAVLIDGPANWTALEAISHLVGAIGAY